MTLVNGQAYLIGQVTGPISATSNGLNSQTGFAAQIDPSSGAVSWSTTIQGADNLSSPNAIAVAPAGASALDQLGLPAGQVGPGQASPLLTANSSVRAGDTFSIVTAGGSSQTVTIQATDTLQSLAARIDTASGYQLVATVLPGANGQQQLKLAPVNPRTQVQLIAGPQGGDALAPLGLTEGVIANPPAPPTSSATANAGTSGASASTPTLQPKYSLNLSSDLNVGTVAGAQAAVAALTSAIGTVKTAYTVMSTPPPPPGSTNSGPVPTYLTDQLSNLQAGLDRLTGGASASSSNSTSSTSTDPNAYLLGLFQ
jgi:hypothetical protein